MTDKMFGEYVREKRKAQGMTQLQLARTINRSQTLIARIENGRITSISNEVRQSIIEVLENESNVKTRLLLEIQKILNKLDNGTLQAIKTILDQID